MLSECLVFLLFTSLTLGAPRNEFSQSAENIDGSVLMCMISIIFQRAEDNGPFMSEAEFDKNVQLCSGNQAVLIEGLSGEESTSATKPSGETSTEMSTEESTEPSEETTEPTEETTEPTEESTEPTEETTEPTEETTEPTEPTECDE